MTKLMLAGLIVAMILISGCSMLGLDKNDDSGADTGSTMDDAADTASLDDAAANAPEDDACEADTDCSYVWFTGGCHTQAHVDAVMGQCESGTGPCPGEAPRRDGVTCQCYANRCITHG
ncbi:MAG: hypothetical protein ABIH41_01300 [Nanoarchaeota archaeon]